MAVVTQHAMNACQEDSGDVVLATERTPNNSNKMEHFIYKGKWVKAYIVMYLKEG